MTVRRYVCLVCHSAGVLQRLSTKMKNVYVCAYCAKTLGKPAILANIDTLKQKFIDKYDPSVK